MYCVFIFTIESTVREEVYQRELARLKEQQKRRKNVRGKSRAEEKEEEERVDVVEPVEGEDIAATLRNVCSLLSFSTFSSSFAPS